MVNTANPLTASRDQTIRLNGTTQPFGSTSDGTPVDLYILQNNTGAEAKITNYGGIVTSLKVPDRNGDLGDVVLGYNELAGYLKDSPYFGALIGRYGNRIDKGRFTLDGVEYSLTTNDYRFSVRR